MGGGGVTGSKSHDAEWGGVTGSKSHDAEWGEGGLQEVNHMMQSGGEGGEGYRKQIT